VWMVNTGWTGGPYGVGERMNIAHTRSMVRAALDGRLARVATRTDPTFGFEVPLKCPDVPASFLDPRSTWNDRDAYDRAAHQLASMFTANFTAYADGVTDDVRAAGPIATDASVPELELAGPGEG
jgi:phosphoenolpyruvate carboxykinase (ATP)